LLFAILGRLRRSKRNIARTLAPLGRPACGARIAFTPATRKRALNGGLLVTRIFLILAASAFAFAAPALADDLDTGENANQHFGFGFGQE
jgi:hypothetical protein